MPFKKLFCLLLSLTSVGHVNAQKVAANLQEGDIIFQKLPCGNLCDAIIETTPCQPGLAFNHCGIVHFEAKKPYVIEAIGKNVQQTDLEKFLKREAAATVYIGRPKMQYKEITAAVDKAGKYIGTPYDNAFLPGDSALYCSELVWECFKEDDKSAFALQPMTFKSPKTNATFPAWTEYYDQLHTAIPEGVEGINPCAIANSDKLTLIKLAR